MKALFKSLSLLAVLAFFFAPGLVRAQDDDQGVSFQTFYDQLGDQGTWVQTDDYGYVFQPNVQDPDWAPYTDGHWVYTDEGWTWVSEEPWGWATYHYGRWVNIDGMGWIWVPGYRWAPAWVSWRYGDGYAGWAPLPPETFEGSEYGDEGGVAIGFHFGSDVDVNFHIGAGCYNFVRVGDLGEPNYRHRYVNRENNFTIINNTTNITNINVNNNYGTVGTPGGARAFAGVNAGGPPIGEVNAQARQRVPTVQLTAANQPGRSTVQGSSLAVFAPNVNPATQRQAKPARVGQTINHPTFNRGDSITKPLAVTASVKPAAPTQQAIQAAATAQASAPAGAKIVTDKTPLKTTLTRPLTSQSPLTPAPKTRTPAATGASAVPPGNTSPAEVNPNGQHRAANAPFTGEPGTHAVTPPSEVKPAKQHNAANAPFTGEPGTHAVTPPNEVKPAKQHNAANAPFTGESGTPAVTPPSEVKPANHAPSNQAEQQAQAQAQREARQQQQQAQAQQEARQQQQAQAQQEARQQQQAQAQQEARQQQQAQAQQEARQQQQAQAQQEARQQQQAQAQQEARQQQQAQAQTQQQAPHQQQQQPQTQQQAPHQQQQQAQGGNQNAPANNKKQKNPGDSNASGQ